MSRRRKKRNRGFESQVNTRALSLTCLFYTVLFAIIGLVFGYIVLYDLMVSGGIGIPSISWLPHPKLTTSILLGIALSESILWPLLLLKPDWF